MDVYDYFESLHRSIAQNHTAGFLAEPPLTKAVTGRFGLFRARIIFWDGSHLTIDETVDTSEEYPNVIYYAYTYVRNNEHVFRYDNVPHHPQIDSFPHHKHVGVDETPEAAQQPTLSRVFQEIEEFLSQKD